MATNSLMDALRQHRLLDLKQLDELNALHFPDPKALAKELIQRGWLTPYQANQLLNAKGQELVLGSYILLERLGEGGMGQVFKARHRNLNRISAIKLIRKERLESPDSIRRFQREVRSAAALSHPNIVMVYDADEIAGTHLMVMEYIEGAIDLAKLVKKNGPLPVEKACDYIRQAALGLQHAYERGMVHRDIKPANLLLTNSGKTVKVLDMGLARLDRPSEDDDDKSSTMTQEGAIMGTPDYIAPEQALDTHTVDIRADLYSLGCAFYYLLTGRVPFPGGTLIQKINKHQFEEPLPIEKLRPEVPLEVAKVVRKLMAKKPEDRYQTPAELVSALAAVSSQRSGVGLAASANELTIAEEKQADAVKEVGRDTLGSAFAYMEKRSDTVAFETPPPVQEKPKNRRWTFLAAIASVFGGTKQTVVAPTQADKSRKKPLPLLWLVGGGVLGLGVLAAAIILFWQTPNGTVRIESDDPNVEIVFDKNGPTIRGADKEPISLRAGEHGILIKRGDFSFEADKFVLKNGQTITLKLEWLPGKVQVVQDGKLIASHAVPPPPTFTNSIGMKFVWIPPGNFMMGSPKEEKEREKTWDGQRGTDETQHKVKLSKGFYMGVYTVTQEQWQEVIDNNPSNFKGEKNLPVENVSWNDCQEFIKKLREKDKKPYRLPTEAEWEYSCRAGMTTPFHFGETISTDQANYNGDRTYTTGKKGAYRQKTTLVGSFPANAWGLFDMQGNIWQWCQDLLGDYSQNDVVDPQGPSEGQYRVLRGGSWYDFPLYCRSAFRLRVEPGSRSNYFGLRVCFSVEEDGFPVATKDPPKKEEAAVPPNPFTNSIGMKFVWIKPGSFTMGSPKEEKEREIDSLGQKVDETQHKVTLTKGFYMGVYTVTQEQWQEVMGKNPSNFKGEKNLPVETVSWDDCQEFIKKMRDKDKKPYRLPTEAEWEYVCRAGTTTPFFFGETIFTNQANYNGEIYGNGKKGVSRGKSVPIGSFPANAYGLHEMQGNVFQWCQDWLGDYPQKEVVDPQGPEKGRSRSLRGGCWANGPRLCRSAGRGGAWPYYRNSVIGLRVCFFVK